MNILRTALSVSGVCGVVLGAALIAGPAAHADGPIEPLTTTELEGWPWSSGYSTSSETTSSIPGLYTDIQSTSTYTAYDNGWLNPIGTYDTSQNLQQFGLGLPIYYNTTSDVVTAATGTAPTVGTTWDASNFGISSLFPLQSFYDLYEAYSESIPGGTAATLWEFLGFGNEYVTGPDGTADFLYAWGNFIPIFDIPAS